MKKRKGFTIIELMVVVLIIGMLASIVMVTLEKGKIKSRDAQRKADISLVAASLENYRVDKKVFPKSNGVSPEFCIVSECDNLTEVGGLFSKYQVSLPVDPLNTIVFKYMYKSNGIQFKIYAKSEGIVVNSGLCNSNNPNYKEINQKAGDYCDPIDNTRFQVSSNSNALNENEW